MKRAAALAIALVLLGACHSGGSRPAAATTTTAPAPVEHPAVGAVSSWLSALARHDDAAAFADLAPRSQAAVGDLGNYRRGSGRFGSIYSRFASPGATVAAPLEVRAGLVVVDVSMPVEGTLALAAVPVREVGGTWRVDPILDVGSYSFRPDDGAVVASTPTIATQLDDPAARARVWFDRSPARAISATSFRPAEPLHAGRHVATIVLLRGEDVVARTLRLEVTR